MLVSGGQSVKKLGIRAGEHAWEVMEQSKKFGEKPLRLVIGKNAIRTVTSLILIEPAEIVELWKIGSGQVIKMSWCYDLCVLSILYNKKDDNHEKTKVFLVDTSTGKKIFQFYKTVKPATVKLSPARPTKKKSIEKVVALTPPSLSTSFKIKKSLSNEKFWRVMDLSVNLEPREVFLGICPTGLRLLEPMSLEPEFVVDSVHVVNFTRSTLYGNPILKLKYFEDRGDGKVKSQKKQFYVLPLTAQDILYYFEHSATIEEAETITLPTIKLSSQLSAPTQSQPQIQQSQQLFPQQFPPLHEQTVLSFPSMSGFQPMTMGSFEPLIPSSSQAVHQNGSKTAREPFQANRSNSQKHIEPNKKLIRLNSEGTFALLQCEKEQQNKVKSNVSASTTFKKQNSQKATSSSSNDDWNKENQSTSSQQQSLANSKREVKEVKQNMQKSLSKSSINNNISLVYDQNETKEKPTKSAKVVHV